MDSILFPIVAIAIWFITVRWVLPRLGFGT